jgi:UDP-N-acetylglucosamine 3-dehydrogenase
VTRRRVALVGLGRMGKNHLRVLAETPGLEVAAVVDPRAPAPVDLKVPYLRTTRELRAIDFDAAVIASPTESHQEVALELVAMGKHLLVEKPLASTFVGGKDVLLAAKAKGTLLAVGHLERFNPAVRKLREILRAGFLGTPIHFAFTRVGGYPDVLMAGNNVLLDLAVHDIDVLRSLVGPLRLEQSMCHVTGKEGVFDTAEIFLGSGSGATAAMHVNWITPTKIRSIRVTGTRGVCFVDYILQTCELHGGSLLKPLEPESSSFDVIHETYRATDKIVFGIQRMEPLRAQAEQFRTFLGGGSVGELCTGRDALAAVLLAERAVDVGRRRGKDRGIGDPPTEGILTGDEEWV